MYQQMFWEALLHQTILALSRTHAGALTPALKAWRQPEKSKTRKGGLDFLVLTPAGS